MICKGGAQALLESQLTSLSVQNYLTNLLVAAFVLHLIVVEEGVDFVCFYFSFYIYLSASFLIPCAAGS